MEKFAGIFSKLVATAGIYFGFYYLGDDPLISLRIVTFTTVGVVGVLAFVCHFIFHTQNAARLGWETNRPDWMFEVGFANLAFGGMGLLAAGRDWGLQAQVVVLLGYALYLFQAAMLHGYRYFTAKEKSRARLWGGIVSTLVLVGMMTFFALHALIL